MLVATRDDEPRIGERYRDRDHDGAHFSPGPSPGLPPRSHLSRLTGLVQFFGSLVGIPLALASGYSLYHSNFSPEAACQSLRANIIGMLDKKADASTLRMLVRRDVITFERNCGAVDADAVAAFRGLLAADPKAGALVAEPVTAAPAAKAQLPSQVQLKAEAPHKAQPEPAAVAKRNTTRHATRDLASDQRDAAGKPSVARATAEKPAELAVKEKPAADAEKVAAHSTEAAAPVEPAAVDAKWIADVREALRESAARSEAGRSAAASPAMAAPLPAPIAIAPPANPAPVQVSADRDGSSQPAASQDDDHPVPPAPIPEPNR